MNDFPFYQRSSIFSIQTAFTFAIKKFYLLYAKPRSNSKIRGTVYKSKKQNKNNKNFYETTDPLLSQTHSWNCLN